MIPMERITRVDGRRGVRYGFHAGQARAWFATKRFVLMLAGTQGGKTEFGPCWLHREVQTSGAGDYMIVSPNFPLMQKKTLPTFLALFQHFYRLGEYRVAERIFTFHDGQTKVFFCHAEDPDSLESATAKAAWLDEAGQKKFKLGSWEAIQRRLSIHQGRALITTTPYDLGWLKQQLHDPWQQTQGQHRDIDVIRFESIENPAFPRAEYERARAILPRWKFDLFYRAIFTRPAGLIYDSFDEARHLLPRFPIPAFWPRYLGLDFGGVHTAGIFFAEEPTTGRLFAYREYGPVGGRTAAEHVQALLHGEMRLPLCVGGSRSEDQWRNEFAAAGLPVLAPTFSQVEIGIDRVYGAHRQDKILVFSDLSHYLAEKLAYSRTIDELGQPTDEIDDKHSFHLMDAERYIIGAICDPTAAEEADEEAKVDVIRT